ncbi:MAG: hypothetical protein QG574_3634 [Cyanobacteriota bacterium erpe_2018_sw_21hr_WHONDRS-SW48-000092_B_bin.40]|jgi:hypothetical protein|nr:hypothetical protein [Cyanobacteriota bacterium erpe_2018_sw_21hr_WHONDRS-SW48-000092_B_bin.40]
MVSGLVVSGQVLSGPVIVTAESVRSRVNWSDTFNWLSRG